MRPHAQADVEIQLINADGSEAEFPATALRCVAAYLYSERGRRKSRSNRRGLKTCVLTGQSQSEYEFEIEMGSAAVEAELAVKLGASEVRGIRFQWESTLCGLREGISGRLAVRSAEIQRSSEFKHGVNVEMVIIDGKHDVKTRFSSAEWRNKVIGDRVLRIGGGGYGHRKSAIASSGAC